MEREQLRTININEIMLESLTKLINVLFNILSNNALLGPTDPCICLIKLEKAWHQTRMNYTHNGQIEIPAISWPFHVRPIVDV